MLMGDSSANILMGGAGADTLSGGNQIAVSVVGAPVDFGDEGRQHFEPFPPVLPGSWLTSSGAGWSGGPRKGVEATDGTAHSRDCQGYGDRYHNNEGGGDRPREERAEITVAQRESAAQALVQQVAENDPEH